MSIPPPVRSVPRWLSLVAGTCAAGCASEVIVESAFPSPLIEELPLRVGLIINDDLYNYIYTEDVPDQSLWTIALGDANLAMLEPLFDRMFSETRVIEAVPVGNGNQDLDAVVEPSLEKFEFDIPLGERDEFVEVWMQYHIKLYEPDGSAIIEWPVSGYGKAELIRDQKEAVQRAAVTAMREVGATISTKFVEQPQVKEWLGERTHGQTAAILPQATGEPSPLPATE
jgi:hypothetical protein